MASRCSPVSTHRHHPRTANHLPPSLPPFPALAPNPQVPPDEQVAIVFRQLDVDGNGTISRRELVAVFFRWFIVGVT